MRFTLNRLDQKLPLPFVSFYLSHPTMIVNHLNTGASTRSYESVFFHLTFSIALALSVIFIVDGLIVNDGSTRRSDGHTWWLVSDITTLISAGLVVVKWAANTWTVLTGWRSAFMLMDEPPGLKASDLGHVASASFLVLFDWWLPWKPRPSGWQTFTIVLIWLLVPASVLSPLITGAVNWQSTNIWVDGGLVTPMYGGPGPSSSWYWYLDPLGQLGLPNVIFGHEPTNTAVGHVGLTWGNSQQPDAGRCRLVMYENSIPLNSTASNATIPCIEIHDISYNSNPSQEIIDVINSAGKNVSLLADNQSGPLFTYYTGNAILFDSSRWNESYLMLSNQTAQLPAPTLFSGVKTFVMFITRQDVNGCKSIGSTAFGDIAAMQKLQPYLYSWQPFPGAENCMLIGSVNFTAGIVQSPKSVYVSNRVVETTTDLPIKPGVLVTDALWMMPDVMPLVSQANTSGIATWDNISNYTEKLIRYSYMASWGSLNSYYGPETPDLAVQRAIPMLQASVSKVRVYLWLFGHSLVTATAILTMVAQLIAQQKKKRIRMVVDYAAVAVASKGKVTKVTEYSQVLEQLVPDEDQSESLEILEFLDKKDKESIFKVEKSRGNENLRRR